jgi:amino acid transporter
LTAVVKATLSRECGALEANPSLDRVLSRRDLVVYGLLFIGPLAPVGVFGVLDARTGGAVALVYLLATAAMSFTAWSYAEMSRVVPHAGSVFAYASAALGRLPGFLAGWLAMLDYLLIPSVAYLFCGISLHALVPGVPIWMFTAAAFVATTALNAMGVRVAARAGFVVLVAEIAVLAVFVMAAAYVLWQQGPARPWASAVVGLDGIDAAMVTGAISIAVLSYLGFDAIAGFAEETSGTTRAVGQAILICLFVAGVLFVLQTWLAAVLSPIAPAALSADPSRQGTTFYDVTRHAIGGWLAALLSITKAIGPAFAAMTAQAAAARLLYGMARDGSLPRALASVDARHRVPRVALFSTAALTLAVSVWAARRPDGLEVLVSIVDVGALAAFALLHVSALAYFVWQRREPPRIGHYLWPVLGAVVTVAVIAAARPLAHVVAGIWLAIGIAVSRLRPTS